MIKEKKMFKSINKVILQGVIEKDPVFRQAPWGAKTCSFPLSTSLFHKDIKTNQIKEYKKYHLISVADQGFAETVQDHFKKGSKVYIEGQLNTRSWETETGEKRYTTEVVVKKFDCLIRDANTSQSSATKSKAKQPLIEDFEDDDVPF
ncbi:MAG TPA: single-stranded DNA-binding protein [Candidatus Babeliaceae bacterium]|nr:single-stranded DNA-binding protein [Candidatus Babeliaceae bacterium]